MKIQNAINKLQKHGFTVTTADDYSFTATKQGLRRVVEFSRNGRSDEATCIGFRPINDNSDPLTDYCATFFCDSLIGAIRSASN
jgi:hypothetical protein